MTCRELADFIVGYLERELPADVQAAFDGHLQRCPNCRAYLSAYRSTIELGRRAFEDDDADVPADVPEELVKSILAARRRAQ